MMKLWDPVNGDELDLMSMKGEDPAIYREHTIDTIVHKLAEYLQVSTDEVLRVLGKSYEGNPVRYHDEIYWAE
jgi:hypothetical protein